MAATLYRAMKVAVVVAVPLVFVAAALWVFHMGNIVGERCQAEPRPRIDWEDCTKAQLLLAGSDLTEAILTSATLTGTDLSRSKMNGTKLDGTEISRTRLIDADLTGATLAKAIGWRADFTGAR